MRSMMLIAIVMCALPVWSKTNIVTGATSRTEEAQLDDGAYVYDHGYYGINGENTDPINCGGTYFEWEATTNALEEWLWRGQVARTFMAIDVLAVLTDAGIDSEPVSTNSIALQIDVTSVAATGITVVFSTNAMDRAHWMEWTNGEVIATITTSGAHSMDVTETMKAAIKNKGTLYFTVFDTTYAYGYNQPDLYTVDHFSYTQVIGDITLNFKAGYRKMEITQ